MKIRIAASNFKQYEKNTLQGFVDITIVGAGLTIKGCTLHAKYDGTEVKRWVGLPAKELKQSDGTTKYVNFLEFSAGEAATAFRESALEAVDALRESVTA